MCAPLNPHPRIGTSPRMRPLMRFICTICCLSSLTFVLRATPLHADNAATGTLSESAASTDSKPTGDVTLTGKTRGLVHQQDGRPGTAAGFEIDGDLLSQGGGDWFPTGGSGTGVIDPNTCSGNPKFAPSFLGHDNIWRKDTDAKFKTRSNKNDDHIGATEKPWNWSNSGGNPQKNDITEIFGHTRPDGLGGSWIIMAAATRAEQGDNHTDFEFNQAGLTITGEDEGLIIGNGPQGGRTVGDLLVSADEVNGNRILIPTLRRWDGNNFVLVPESEWTGKFFAMHNSDRQVVAPCGAVDAKGVVRGMYDGEQFIEIAIHSSLIANFNPEPCGNPASIMVKTRSSHSWTAELKDFAFGGIGGPQLPACVISGPESICPGSTATLCGPEGAGVQYLWSTGETTRCITINGGGSYSLTISAAGCPGTTCTKTVTVTETPLCAITGPETLCPGSTAQLCGPEGAGLTYQWSTGATSRCITVSAGGTYTLTVFGGSCGPATCSKTVTPSTAPVCTIEGPERLCPGQTVELCGPDGAGFTYSWSNGATTRCITVTEGGTYTLTVFGGKCGTATCSKTVTASPGPVCSITGPAALCPGQSSQLCGPEGAGLTYSWSTGATTRCIDITQPGEYTLTVSTSGCGSSTGTKSVAPGLQPACLVSGPSTLCPGQTAELCGPEGIGLTYSWSSGETTRCITISTGGTYTLTITGPCGTSSCSKTVTQGSAPVCSITGPSSLCPTQTGELCGPEGAGLTYLWSNGETTRCITISAPGDYSLTVSSAGCGTATCTKTVAPGTQTVCSISGPSSICTGQSAELCGPEGTGLTYSWSSGETTRCITITAGGTYTLTVSGGSCGPSTCSKTVTEASAPTCSIDGPDRLCPGQDATLCGPEGANFT